MVITREFSDQRLPQYHDIFISQIFAVAIEAMDGHWVDNTPTELVELYFGGGPAAPIPGWRRFAIEIPRRHAWPRVEIEGECSIYISLERRIAMDLHSAIADAYESTFAIFWTPHYYPTMSSDQTARFKWDDRYSLALLSRYVYWIHDSLDDDINAIGVRSTNVVAKLCVTKRKLSLVRSRTEDKRINQRTS